MEELPSGEDEQNSKGNRVLFSLGPFWGEVLTLQKSRLNVPADGEKVSTSPTGWVVPTAASEAGEGTLTPTAFALGLRWRAEQTGFCAPGWLLWSGDRCAMCSLDRR